MKLTFTSNALLISAFSLLSLSTLSLPTLAHNIEQDTFFKKLSAYCGQSFEGKVTSNDSADEGFKSKKLIMHVRECNELELKIPFHVGDDHSRTWVISKIEHGLKLKHDHRHKDGSSDKVTMYGGDTASEGTATEQSFPVDAESIANFTENGLSQSVTNVWHVYLNESTFTYRLTRKNRDFQVDFDLTKPVATPPVPWGHK